MAVILDGKSLANLIKEDLKKQVARLKEQGITPGLAAILVGEGEGSVTYVNSKQRACEKLGIYSQVHELSEDTTQEELTNLIINLNHKAHIHGILVQLPLPGHIDKYAVMDRIHKLKDVDGFRRYNQSRLYRGEDCFEPCTPKGILTLLDYYKIPIEGKHVVIVGRSDIIGKPLYHMMLKRNATITQCHSRTADLAGYTRQADILVAAIGKPRYITKDMVREGAVVIDVGINRAYETLDGHKKIVGDVDFDNVKNIASHITPVPYGVGPMTIVSLIQNTLKAAHIHSDLQKRQIGLASIQ